MLIGVYIPSLKRPEALQRAAGALNAQGYPFEAFYDHQEKPQPLHRLVNAGVATLAARGVNLTVVLADHIVVKPNFFRELEAAVKKKGFDQMYGLNVVNLPENRGRLEYSFFAVGATFVDRFPKKQIFCPDYYHFYSDTELGMYATSIDKFTFVEKAEIHTYHPNAGNTNADETHRASRKYKLEENNIWKRRRSRDILWGASTQLLGEGSWR